MHNDRRIRVGVIGCGQFMSRQHIQTIARSPRLVLQHLADLDAEKLSRVAKRYQPNRSSTCWHDVLSDPEVDLVVIGVVPRFHAEMAQAALEQGKPVYVEKPLALTPEECLAIQQTARQRKLSLAVGFNRRFAPATELTRKAFRVAGPAVSVHYRISDDNRIRSPGREWKNEDRLLIEVVHIFDLLTYLIGAEPVGIYARESRWNDAMITVEFQNGSLATIHSSDYGSLAQPKEHLEAVLDHGAVEMVDFVEVRSYGLSDLPRRTYFAGRAYDDCDNSHVDDFAARGLAALLDFRCRYTDALVAAGVLRDHPADDAWQRLGQALGHPPLPQVNYASDKGWGVALESFCTAVAEGTIPHNATAIDGNRATHCAVLARRSIDTGQSVQLDPRNWLVD